MVQKLTESCAFPAHHNENVHHQGGTCSLGERWWFPGSSLLTLNLFIVFQMCLRTSPSATGKWPCDLCQPFMGTWNPSARWCPCSCNGLSVTSGLWGELESIPLSSDSFFVSSTHCKCLIFSFPSPTQRTPVLLVEVSFFYLLLFQHPFKFIIQVESLVYIFCLRFDPASKGFLQKSVLS